MPLRKPTDHEDGDESAPVVARPFPPEAYEYEAELSAEVVGKIQDRADEQLRKDEWVVIDGIGKR
jgi:hypothetical protein